MKSNVVLLALVIVALGFQAVTSFKGREQSSQGSPAVPASLGTSLNIDGMPIRGDRNARLVLIEFSDYECPFCSRHALGAGKTIDKRFVSTGQIQHAFVNYPLPIHPKAVQLATAAICAGEQNKYWEMHDDLFEKGPRSLDDIVRIAAEMKLDLTGFRACMLQGRSVQINKDLAAAKMLRLTSTPAFALGRLDPTGNVAIESFVYGAQPTGIFEQAIQKLDSGIEAAR